MSHGSKSNNMGVWAMAQRSIILGFEPRLKGNFVAIFEVIKALQFRCFFKLHIYSPHYRNINNSDFALSLSIWKFAKTERATIFKSDFFGYSKIFVYNFWTNQVFDPQPCLHFTLYILIHYLHYGSISTIQWNIF